MELLDSGCEYIGELHFSWFYIELGGKYGTLVIMTSVDENGDYVEDLLVKEFDNYADAKAGLAEVLDNTRKLVEEDEEQLP